MKRTLTIFVFLIFFCNLIAFAQTSESRNQNVTGSTIIKYPNGDVYEGNVSNGIPEGSGKKIYANGITYVGEWSKGQRNGKGKLVYPNGDIYEGGFSNGKKNGNGIFIWKNPPNTGDLKYEGQYVDDIEEGRGKHFWVNGDSYEGDYRSGSRTGKGKYTWKNGDVYTGNFLNNQLNGEGVVVFSDGEKKSGIFTNSEFDELKTKKYFSEKKLLSEQEDKQKKLNSEIADQKRIDELRSRKYSVFPAKLTAKSQDNGWNQAIIVTSVDDEPFLLERVVVNNKTGISSCDKGKFAEYMRTGDARSIPITNCGDVIVKVDVYTNRGTSSYKFGN